MKKFLAIAAIAATFTACNNDKKSEETTKDTSTVVTPMADTAHVVTTTTTTTDTMSHKMGMDSASKKMDTKMEGKKP